MKVAIYVADGTTQVVLTPETAWEKTVAELVLEDQGQVQAFKGIFYECQGGWFRQSPYEPSRETQSIILRLDKTLDNPPPAR